MSGAVEVRSFLAIDLPLVHRLTPTGISLDSATKLTRGVHTIEGAVWGSVPLADLGTPTFVLRDGDNGYVAQFRHRSGEKYAHIVFIAPDCEYCPDEDAWLRLLDAMVVAAGRRGALTLNAEVAETSAAFLLLRQAGFAVYARQEIWKREPAPLRTEFRDVLRPVTDVDAIGLNSLYLAVVPRMVRQADPVPDVRDGGLVYEYDGKPAAYLTVREGKYGIYVQALMQPDVCYDAARDILASVLSRLPRIDKVPAYFNVRRYQDWLQYTLDGMGFTPFASQAVMVRHTTRRVEHVAFKPAQAENGTLALPSVKEFASLGGERSLTGR